MKGRNDYLVKYSLRDILLKEIVKIFNVIKIPPGIIYVLYPSLYQDVMNLDYWKGKLGIRKLWLNDFSVNTSLKSTRVGGCF